MVVLETPPYKSRMTRFRSDLLLAATPLFRIAGAFVLVAVLASVYVFSTNPTNIGELLKFAVCIVATLLLIICLVVIANRFSYIDIEPEGICGSFFGHRGKIFPWRTVTAIYRITYFDKQLEKNQTEFILTSKDRRPFFVTNLIENQLEMTDAINGYIQSYNISAFKLGRSIKGRGTQLLAALGSQADRIGPPDIGEMMERVSQF